MMILIATTQSIKQASMHACIPSAHKKSFSANFSFTIFRNTYIQLWQNYITTVQVDVAFDDVNGY